MSRKKNEKIFSSRVTLFDMWLGLTIYDALFNEKSKPIVPIYEEPPAIKKEESPKIDTSNMPGWRNKEEEAHSVAWAGFCITSIISIIPAGVLAATCLMENELQIFGFVTSAIILVAAWGYYLFSVIRAFRDIDKPEENKPPKEKPEDLLSTLEESETKDSCNTKRLIICTAGFAIILFLILFLINKPSKTPTYFPGLTPSTSSTSRTGTSSYTNNKTTKIYEQTYPKTTTSTVKSNAQATSKPTTKSKSSDPYDVHDYSDVEDFYYFNYDDFVDFEDAEDYYEEHMD